MKNVVYWLRIVQWFYLLIIAGPLNSCFSTQLSFLGRTRPFIWPAALQRERSVKQIKQWIIMLHLMNCHFSTVFPSISQQFHCQFSSRDAPYQKWTRELLEFMLRLTLCILSLQILNRQLQQRRCQNLGYSDQLVYTSYYRLVTHPAAPSTPLSSPLKIYQRTVVFWSCRR